MLSSAKTHEGDKVLSATLFSVALFGIFVLCRLQQQETTTRAAASSLAYLRYCHMPHIETDAKLKIFSLSSYSIVCILGCVNSVCGYKKLKKK